VAAAAGVSALRRAALVAEGQRAYAAACEMHRQGRAADAVRRLGPAVQAARQGGDAATEAQALARMGLIFGRGSRHQKAAACFRAALAAARASGAAAETPTALLALQGLAGAQRAMGNADLAEAAEREAAALLRRGGAAGAAAGAGGAGEVLGADRRAQVRRARALEGEAVAALGRGEGEEGIRLLERALDVAMQARAPLAQPYCRARAGRAGRRAERPGPPRDGGAGRRDRARGGDLRAARGCARRRLAGPRPRT
jgi:tetratricopeptide (TPR) repeat protein